MRQHDLKYRRAIEVGLPEVTACQLDQEADVTLTDGSIQTELAFDARHRGPVGEFAAQGDDGTAWGQLHEDEQSCAYQPQHGQDLKDTPNKVPCHGPPVEFPATCCARLPRIARSTA